MQGAEAAGIGEFGAFMGINRRETR